MLTPNCFLKDPAIPQEPPKGPLRILPWRWPCRFGLVVPSHYPTHPGAKIFLVNQLSVITSERLAFLENEMRSILMLLQIITIQRPESCVK